MRVHHMLKTHTVSDSKHIRGEKKNVWIYPPTWKLVFTQLLIGIEYI